MELKMEKIEEVFEKDSDGILRRQRKPNRSAKNFKGLKNLSENVYQIVSELGGTTYKEVAEKLISKLHGRVRKDMGYEGSKD